MLELALRKLGFNGSEIRAMSEGEATAWLAAHHEAVNPPKKKTYKVSRRKQNG